jgi:hypothetical protein
MVSYGTILGFIVSKEGKTHDPKKTKALKSDASTQNTSGD